MACGRAFFIILILSLLYRNTESKVYTRCKLTRDLLKQNFPRTFISNWVCLIEQGSDKNTSALLVKSERRKFYGLFQIGSEWCKEGRKGGKCNIPCEVLLDEDIRDDGECAIKIFDQEGFKYWPKWEARCKGQTLPDIEKCPDWQLPPSRSSPPRDKRYLRPLYHQFNYFPARRLLKPRKNVFDVNK